MRKPLLLFSVLVLFFATSRAQDKKVAVVTFYFVKQVDVSGFGGANTQEAVSRLADDPKFNLRPALKTFHDHFFSDYSKSFPFQFVPEEQVIGSSLYKDFFADAGSGVDVLQVGTNLPAKGYKVILPVKGNVNEKALLKIIDQCDGIMKVYVDFAIEKRGFGGVAVVKINARAHFDIFNRKGDKVFSLKEEALSKISGAFVTGIPFFTVPKVLPLCESAMDELMIALQNDLPNKVKKADHKL